MCRNQCFKPAAFVVVKFCEICPSRTKKYKRNVTAGHMAAGEIVRENPEACVECHPLDLSSFSSVRSFAKKTKGAPVSAVIHNAGVMAPPYSTTIDGHELTFQV